jgi:long-chain acyl-CoA synthetase
MLYEHWRQTAQENGRELALRDLRSGQQWTFEQLAIEAERGQLTDHPFAHPSGIAAEFIVGVLRAWRSGQVVCPLESGQSLPVFNGRPPPRTVHLKMTSASTGGAQVIAFTAEQLAADARNIVTTMGLRPYWPNLGVISLAHSYGFSSLVLPLLLHGIPLFLLDSPLPETVRRALVDLGPVTVPAVPALWRAWHDADALTANMRLAISAGAHLPLALEQAVFNATGVKIHNFYGASECGGIAFDASATPRADSACAGAPMRNVNVAPGADGCLQVQSHAVGETYWPEPGPQLGHGCFQTSDLADLMEGLVYLRGRLSAVINVAGRKIAPENIEAALLMHPDVRACVVFGAPSPDPDRSETTVACVAGSPTLTSEELKHFLSTRLPGWQVPREWWFVPALEVNPRGKLSRAEWRRRYLAEGRNQ